MDMTMKTEIIIETERLIMRRWREDDAMVLFRYASDARVSELALWPRHTSVDMSLWVIREVFMPNPHSFAIVLRESGEPVGCIGLVPEGDEHHAVRDGEMEVGYWIGYPYWNRGLVTEALRAFTDEYCRSALGLQSLLITTDIRNAGSQRVAEKAGFLPIGEYEFDGIPGKAFRLELESRHKN